MGYFCLNLKDKDSIDDWIEMIEVNLKLFKDSKDSKHLLVFIESGCENIKRIIDENTSKS